MVGKSSVAAKIASMFEVSCLSTDDIGEILQTTADLNPMSGKNYLDYYASKSVKALIEDMKAYHKGMEPAIQKMIDIHSEWGKSMILEGYAIYPGVLKMNPNVDAIWLIATEELLKKRVEESGAFKSASQEIKEKYLARSLWHNRFLKEECEAKKLKYVGVTGAESMEVIVEKVLTMIDIQFR